MALPPSASSDSNPTTISFPLLCTGVSCSGCPGKCGKCSSIAHMKSAKNIPLTSAGVYPRVRQVLDIDGYYVLAGEYLECSKCTRKLISWSPSIVKQLNIGHQLQFPVLITHKYACDVKVVRLLRTRGAGNSSTQVYRKLKEATWGGMVGKVRAVFVRLEVIHQSRVQRIDHLWKTRRPSCPSSCAQALLVAYCLLARCSLPNRRN